MKKSNIKVEVVDEESGETVESENEGGREGSEEKGLRQEENHDYSI